MPQFWHRRSKESSGPGIFLGAGDKSWPSRFLSPPHRFSSPLYPTVSTWASLCTLILSTNAPTPWKVTTMQMLHYYSAMSVSSKKTQKCTCGSISHNSDCGDSTSIQSAQDENSNCCDTISCYCLAKSPGSHRDWMSRHSFCMRSSHALVVPPLEMVSFGHWTVEQMAIELSGLRLLELGVLGLWEVEFMLVDAEESAGWKPIRGPIDQVHCPNLPRKLLPGLTSSISILTKPGTNHIYIYTLLLRCRAWKA